MAKIIDDSTESLVHCVKNLKSGFLVAFPTETVYGLGALISDDSAVESVFIAKKRPKTDPLIVHIADTQKCSELMNLNDSQEKIFKILSESFWPGPLTLVVPRSKKISALITAGSDYVGIRIPSHKIARKFLHLCGRPIVAPSANTFGHVSPTTAQHVFDDLKNVSNLLIIKSDQECTVGIESTILKLSHDNKICILRMGAISAGDIEKKLDQENISYELEIKRTYIANENLSEIQNVPRGTFLNESSGQFLKHYSPWKETYIYRDQNKNQLMDYEIKDEIYFSTKEFSQSVFIDFGRKNYNLCDKFIKYFDLSPSADLTEAMQNLFQILREAEQVKNSIYILISEFSVKSELAEALFDRIYRAASGKFVLNQKIS